jgi:hypothetical protein
VPVTTVARSRVANILGADGLVPDVLGHDRSEMYVVGRPTMGPVLIHVATIAESTHVLTLR